MALRISVRALDLHAPNYDMHAGSMHVLAMATHSNWGWINKSVSVDFVQSYSATLVHRLSGA